jgi:surface protein
MSAVFNLTVFNQPIGDWNTGNVTNMGGLFNGATAFNQNINTWNTSKVTNFLNTFNRATAFNQPLDNWNTGAVTNMRSMFERASAFNQSIGNWNTSSVTNMRTMFLLASNFNQDLSAWDVSKVTDLTGMLLGASAFNQSLGSWSLNASVQMGELLNNCGMNCSNYSRTLYEWAQNPNIPSGRTLGATSRQYGPDAIAARATLVTGKGWTINGDSPGTGACAFPRPFVTEWVFTNPDSIIQFNALTTGGSVTYTWSARPSGTSGSGSFTQATAGAVNLGGLTISAGDTVTLNLSIDNLSRFYMLNTTAAAKLSDVKQWSTVAWTSMASAFANCSNLRITATDSPILTGVTSMANMFDGASVFNTDISGWNTATVTDMSGTFNGAAAFNQDISTWNTGNVTNFSGMFHSATAFNQPFTNWTFDEATDLTLFISGSGLDCENYTNLLLKLANNPNTPQGLDLGAGGMVYGTGGVNARNKLIIVFDWTIVGDEPGNEPCVNCPDLSMAPAEVLVTNSTCTSNCTPSGGSLTAPTSPCPEMAFLQYQLNGGSWTDTLPAYAQTGPAQTIKTRCICENDDSFISPASAGVLTAPGTCTLPDASITGTSTVCAGGSTNLTAAGASTFSWSTSATTANITVSPASTTTYRVTVTAANGCTDTASVQVTVLPLPAITCPSDMMVNTSAGGAGDCSGLASWTHPLETAGACTPLVLRMLIDDNGSPSVVTAGAVVNQALNAGSHTIAYTITDGGNNMAQCSFTIEVLDDENPSLTCVPNAELRFNGEEIITLDAQQLASASDNCGIVLQQISPSTISVDQIGQTVPVQMLVADQANNPAGCEVSVQVKGLPRGWRHNSGSVGDCNSAVSFSPQTGVWTGDATNCRNSSPFQSDKLMFAQYTLCGDGSITAQVTDLSGGMPFGGICMRESNDPGAKKVQMSINRSSNILRREIRNMTGGQAFPMDFSSPYERTWLRIVRTGNMFRGYTSMDGITWWYVMQVHVPMNSCIEIGLMLTNMQQNVPGTVTFSNVSVTGTGSTLNITTSGDAISQDMEAALDVQVFPNPTDGQLTVDVSAYAGRAIQLTIYDMRGQIMLQRNCLDEGCGDDYLQLNLGGLPAGMYLLGVKAEGLPEVSKRLVIQK